MVRCFITCRGSHTLGADLRNICTEAGMLAIGDNRAYITHDDMMKAARKVAENKRLESKLDYKKV